MVKENDTSVFTPEAILAYASSRSIEIEPGLKFKTREDTWVVVAPDIPDGAARWKCESSKGQKHSFFEANIKRALMEKGRVEENGTLGHKFFQEGRLWTTISVGLSNAKWLCRDATGKEAFFLAEDIIALTHTLPSPDDIFEQAEESAGATAPPSNETIAKLATDMTVLNDWCKTAEAKLKAKQKEVEAMKLQLYDLLVATNHSQGWKFDNGINIAPKETETVFAAKGISDDKVYGWLFTNGLGDLIKTTAHWRTLSNAVLAWQESNRQEDGSAIPLPEIFNLQVKKTVHFRGNGASQFLKRYHEEQENENPENHN